MEIPRNSFQTMRNGRAARLRVKDLPIPDTFFFANNVSISAQIDVDVEWHAISPPVTRGNGLDATEPFWDKFIGEFADADCSGHGGGSETGFNFKTGKLTSDGFYASIGYQRNGVFLE